MTTTAVVLDGDQRAALAVVRSLGSRGLRVIVCSTRSKSLAGASRWCHNEYVVPNVEIKADALVPALAEIVKQEQASIIFPITDATLTQLSGRTSVAEAVVACPPKESYFAVSDKSALVQRALELGVRAPRSVVVNDDAEYRDALSDWSGPVVIKPACSRYRSGDAIRSTSVIIAEDRAEALAVLPRLCWLGRIPCLLQEFVSGHGAGVFAVYDHCGPVGWFSHKRLREKPPSGGVSVLCESAPLDVQLERLAKTLLDDAQWLGPAMVEFRIDSKGLPWLMEINGRFWGSLQLSIDCGLDLPWLWYQIMTGARPQPIQTYKTGVRLRWLLGDLDSTYLTLRKRGMPTGEKLRSVLRFLNFFERRTRFEVLRSNDIRPFFRELRTWLRSAFRLNGND